MKNANSKKSNGLSLFFIMLIFCCQPLFSYSQTNSVAGVYKTDFNEMTLNINGNQVTGTYNYKNGMVEGVLYGNKLLGTWTQSNSRGRLEFIFNADYSAFTGKWSYNDSEPSSKWNGTKISGGSVSEPLDPFSAKSKIEGTYTTDFKEMTLRISGNRVTGTYKHMDGKIDGILEGNKLIGTWIQSNGRGKFEFTFTDDFSSFTGKWGYNESVPSSKWNGKKIGSSGVATSNTSVIKDVPVNIAGSWSTSGSKEHRGRINFWQNGNDFIAIAAWPDETTGKWKSYKGEGRIVGRQMEFKVFPSTTDGSSTDQGYVYYMTISSDNSTITGYYTRNGNRTVDANFYYKLVQ